MAKVKTHAASKHPKTEDAPAPKKSPPVAKRAQPTSDFIVSLSREGLHPQVSLVVEPVSLGNPTVMAAKLQELRDKLEQQF